MSKLLELLKQNEGKTFSSPRPKALNYRIEKIDENKQSVLLRFSSGIPLYLKFATFNAVIDYLVENSDRYNRVGATTHKSYNKDTVEYVIQSLEPHLKTHTKRAPHICDLLHLGGFIHYGKAVNPRTMRNCQAVKWDNN